MLMNKTKIALYSQLQRLWVKENKKEEVINILPLSTFLPIAISSPLYDVVKARFSLLVFLVDIDDLLGNAIPIILAHIIVDMSQWSFDNLPKLFGKFIHVATMEVIILW